MVSPDVCLGAQLGSFAPLCSNAILNDIIGAATRAPDLCEYDFTVHSKGDIRHQERHAPLADTYARRHDTWIIQGMRAWGDT